ncbi:linear amide C-N hydrolase [Paraferrimonas sedimenticola]|uniref:Choloylglycine hydrolase n=1 Tax=Paraferrimonas sedimenticola TaxID=375674 RepID=A0AA37RW28_9GAMM|nr:linear amide C-N hydrolase [Paraferrimonas sedimenticola]GLP96306.1 choloylglycine hydrolase [Paraferrimonas sedimenticola]
MNKKLISLALASALTAGLTATANACTYATFDNAAGNTFTARSMEWPGEIGAKLVISPRGHDFGDFKAKYGFAGMDHDGFVSSGMNEKGLSVELLALGEFNVVEPGQGDLAQGSIAGMLLGNAKNVDEAIEILKNTKIEGHEYAVVGGLVLGIHLAITDGDKSIVVEWLDGSGYPEIFENKLGVMTNDPNYPTQEALAMMMLGGDLESGNAKFAEETFIAADSTPIGRFQRMVAANYTQDETLMKTDLDGVNRAWTMINSVDIPQGSLYWRFASDLPQFTSWSTVMDLDNKAYYFRTYDNMDIRKVAIGEMDFSKVKFQKQEIFKTATDYQQVQY